MASAYRSLIATAPDEVGGGLVYITGPPEDFVPAHLQNKLVSAVLVTYCGPEAGLREFIAPLLALEPAGQFVADLPYAELQSMLDDPPGFRNYWSAEHLKELPDEALDRFCARSADMIVPSPSQHVAVPARRRGVAWCRVAGLQPSATPGWSTRSACGPTRPTTTGPGPGRARCRRTSGRGRPATCTSTSSATRARSGSSPGFGLDNYRRLARLKAELDPDNVFNRWHNVRPRSGAGV